jgi:type I restriction enzyme S subunit
MFFVQNGGTPKTSVPEYWGGDLAWVTPEDLGKNEGRFIHSSRRTVTNRGVQASNAELVPAGSIVMSTRAPIGYTAIAGLPLATNQGCKTLVPNREIDSRFFEYELSVRTSDLNVLGTGATFMELSTDALASFRVPVPPLASQRRIADFLDRETERIDALIDKKRRLIDLLEEKRTATITHAVTKGLNPAVPMVRLEPSKRTTT